MYIDEELLTDKPYTYGMYPNKIGGMSTGMDCLNQFRKLIKQRDVKTFLEIGTFDGIIISVLAEENPDVIFHVIDPFMSGHNTSGGHFDCFLCNNFHNKNIYLHRKTSMEALSNIVTKFDMAFIDGDHSYEGVKFDAEAVNNLMNPNGLIAFHDYDHLDVKRAVDEFCSSKDLKLYQEGPIVACVKP